MRRLAILLALALAPAALASDAALHDANVRYGPAARACVPSGVFAYEARAAGP